MERSLESILQRSRLSKDRVLLLQNLHLEEIPDLSGFGWVTELNLGNNNISDIVKCKLPPNLKELILYQNKLSVVDPYHLLDTIEILDISKNFLNFDGTHFYNIKKLTISHNSLTEFKYPPNIEQLDISHNSLTKIDEFPSSMIDIDCSNNELDELPMMYEGLKRIDLSHNHLTVIEDFPNSTIYIEAEGNSIADVKGLPSGLEELHLSDNRIQIFEAVLPPSLTALDLSDNMLTEMPDLPTNIETIDLSNNRLINIKYIPESVKMLDISNNCLTELSDELKKRDIRLSYGKNMIDDEESEYESFWMPGNKVTHNSTNHFDEYNINRWRNLGTSTAAGTGWKYDEFNIDNWRSANTTPAYSFSSSKTRASNPNYVSINNKKHVIV